MLLDDIADHLASSLTLIVGADIFMGEVPDSPDSCIIIIPYGGLPPQHTMGTDHAIRKPRFQVVCRGERDDFQAPMTTANSVYGALHFKETTINSTRYLRCEAIDEPNPLRRDDNERWEITCNYEAWFDGA